ncbi:symplekin-like [Forsythia ovata]|uniref:Symplekin-like n=1 Tax=Forsythia ovata TaxID=205694 RepID=A0ABD1RK28_9LAMI
MQKPIPINFRLNSVQFDWASEATLAKNAEYASREYLLVGSQETSVSGSQISDPGISENDSIKVAEEESTSDSAISFSQAQRLVSLFFALCAKVGRHVHSIEVQDSRILNTRN